MNDKNRTKTTILSGASALGLAICVALVGRVSSVPEPQPEPAGAPEAAAYIELDPGLPMETIAVTEPVYVIVGQADGAPMATAGLPVEEVVFEDALQIRVFRTPEGAVAIAEPHAPR